jgi:hypothetical protein
MTRAPLHRHLINAGAVLGIVLLLGNVSLAVNHWDDLALQQRMIDEATQQAQAQQRRELAAVKVCGPNAEPRWISDTELACRNNGNKVRHHTITRVTP